MRACDSRIRSFSTSSRNNAARQSLASSQTKNAVTSNTVTMLNKENKVTGGTSLTCQPAMFIHTTSPRTRKMNAIIATNRRRVANIPAKIITQGNALTASSRKPCDLKIRMETDIRSVASIRLAAATVRAWRT